jgi:hypothetical protein
LIPKIDGAGCGPLDRSAARAEMGPASAQARVMASA